MQRQEFKLGRSRRQQRSRRRSTELLATPEECFLRISRRAEQRQPGTGFQTGKDVPFHLDGTAVRTGVRVDDNRRRTTGVVL